VKNRVTINTDERVVKARTQEEKDAWEANRSLLQRVDFCEGWLVEIYKHACGHWEILQHPVSFQCSTPAEIKARLTLDATTRRCTRCLCGR